MAQIQRSVLDALERVDSEDEWDATAMAFSTDLLVMTRAEFTALTTEIGELTAKFRSNTRTDPPADARRVRWSVIGMPY
jgi:hypothetical protein